MDFYLVSATNRNNCEILMQRHSGIVNETKAFIKKRGIENA